nr:hypothetical protein [uncultured Acetatifactor sp.]
MAACLSGCGDAVPAGSPLGTDAPKDSVSVSDRIPQADTASESADADRKGADDDELLNQNGGTQGSTVESETSPEPADTKQPVASPEPEAPTASPDIDSIAGLGGLQAVVVGAGTTS